MKAVPIKPELRHFYGREWRKITRPRILRRAHDRCEDCGVKNGTCVWRVGRHWWQRSKAKARGMSARTGHRITRPLIVLTVAHLNHTPGDDRDENLKALCQWCHLNHDKQHHHETRAARKDAYKTSERTYMLKRL